MLFGTISHHQLANREPREVRAELQGGPLTHRLVLHAREDYVEHLCERGLGGGLVYEIAAGQVDVIAGPDGEQHRALVDLDVGRRYSGQQGLRGGEESEEEEEVKV